MYDEQMEKSSMSLQVKSLGFTFIFKTDCVIRVNGWLALCLDREKKKRNIGGETYGLVYGFTIFPTRKKMFKSYDCP